MANILKVVDFLMRDVTNKKMERIEFQSPESRTKGLLLFQYRDNGSPWSKTRALGLGLGICHVLTVIWALLEAIMENFWAKVFSAGNNP